MDKTNEPKPETPELTFDFSMRNLDPETLQILLDDRIATGG